MIIEEIKLYKTTIVICFNHKKNMILFSFSEIDTPPCWEIVKANKAKFGDNPPADFVNPNCDEDGYFTPLQCILSPLRCYCVDKYGNTKTEPSNVMLLGIPDCKNFTQGSTTTQVQPTIPGNDVFHL